jgi:Outer membrane protein beta-barrel domain
MKNALLLVPFLFVIKANHAQVKPTFKDRFTQGFSVGVTQASYIYNLRVGFGEATKSLFSEVSSVNPTGWGVGYNLEYRINKNFSVRTQLDVSKSKTILSLMEFSGLTRQIEFGSLDVGLPIHLMYRMSNKKLRPIVFMGFKTMLLNETDKDKSDINLAIFETGIEAGLGLEYNFKGLKIRQEVALYNGFSSWLNDEYIYARRAFYNIKRDYFSFRLVFSENKN